MMDDDVDDVDDVDIELFLMLEEPKVLRTCCTSSVG